MRVQAKNIQKRWEVKPQATPEKVAHLATALGIDEVLSSLLVQRGIETFDEAKAFFRPDLNDLHDPGLMRDMDKAVEVLNNAIEQHLPILVYGDYDVDGSTAVSMMYHFLEGLGADVEYYIPDRYAEGYGVSMKGMEYARDQKKALIISLDCGIKANESIAFAKDAGIDFIVCDHHLPSAELPPATAILDQKRPGCAYPYKELSGCGVGFKLLTALCTKRGIPFEEILPYLDLLAVSICCDIVPITGENRILTWHGIKRINEAPRKGIETLLKISDKRRAVSVSDIVFQVGPRINAAGRLESARKAVELLISGDEALALQAGEYINQQNEDRKELDKSMTRHALSIIAENDELVHANTTVLFNENWHKGVIGIVCSRLMETYYRPTILLTESNGMVTGSARSVKGFDIHAAIGECSDLLHQFGGHMYAAGLTMDRTNVEAFQQRFEEVVTANIEKGDLIPTITADAEITLDDITPKFFRIIEQLAPFGPQNMRPVFIAKGLRDTGWAKVVGEDHLKMTVGHPDCVNRFGAIAFGHGRHLAAIKSGKSFDLAFTVEENEWQGKVSLQLNVKDVRICP